jgi:hypothetical protein
MRRAILSLGFLALQACSCAPSGGGCEYVELSIERTAPADKATTGRNQRFAVLVHARGDTGTLLAAARLDGGAWLPCRRAIPPVQEIGGQLAYGEFYFACPITGATLAPGTHTVEYSADGGHWGTPKRAKAVFSHDTSGPKLAASAVAGAGTRTVAWQIGGSQAHVRVGLFRNGVEVTRTYGLQGAFVVDESIARPGDSIEIRAVDAVGNDTREALVIP